MKRRVGNGSVEAEAWKGERGSGRIAAAGVGSASAWESAGGVETALERRGRGRRGVGGGVGVGGDADTLMVTVLSGEDEAVGAR